MSAIGSAYVGNARWAPGLLRPARRKFLNVGVGFGAGSLPKGIRAFMARAGKLCADRSSPPCGGCSVAAATAAASEWSSWPTSSPTASFPAGASPSSVLRPKLDGEGIRDSPEPSVAAELQLQDAVLLCDAVDSHPEWQRKP
jgi:hypothetical protein